MAAYYKCDRCGDDIRPAKEDRHGRKLDGVASANETIFALDGFGPTGQPKGYVITVRSSGTDLCASCIVDVIQGRRQAERPAVLGKNVSAG